MEFRSGIVIALLLICFSGSVLAATDPNEISWGAFKVIPTIIVTEKYDDNIFSADRNEEDAWITQFEPAVGFISKKDANIYAFTYQGDYGFFDGSSDDDYDDHNFAADLHFDLGSKARLDLLGSYGFLHDARGTGASEGIGLIRPEPDEYESADVSATLELGSESAKFGITLDVSVVDIEYQNNRAQTKFRDRKDTRTAATLFMRVAPKTSLLLQGSVMDLEYDSLASSGSSLDSEETAFLVGVKWEITGKTTGSIKVGTVDKDFDASARGGDDMTTWDIEISWSPRTYSTLIFSSSSTPRETNGTGQFIDSRLTSVFWIHDWSARVHTLASYSTGSDEFNRDPREDDIDRLEFSVNYDFRRWLNVGVGYSIDEKDSNVSLFDYDRDVFSVSFDLSL